jgi:hypothetical protein
MEMACSISLNGVLIALSGGGVSVIDGNDITYILDGGLLLMPTIQIRRGLRANIPAALQTAN